MAVPSTTGSLRTTLASMNIGDYIAFNYDTTATGVAGVVSNIGTATGIEIPTSGIAIPNVTNGNLAYFLKVREGMCISDRVVQNSISYNTLNSAKYIEGKIQSNPCVLMHMEETIKDEYDNYIAMIGSPSIDTNTYKVGSSSLYLNSSSCLNISYPNNDYATMEGWFNYISCAKQWNFICTLVGATFGVYVSNTGKLGMWYYNVGSLGSTQLYPNTWYHFAIVMKGNSQKLYLNGQLEATGSFAFPHNVGILKIGGWTDNVNHLWNGYIDEFKMSSDVEYAGNFTPQTTPFDNPSNVYLIRSLYGGNGYIDSNGNISATNSSLGCFPSNNEWDKYIVNSTLGDNIIAGNDNVWHWNNSTSTWCNETPITTLGANTNRVIRGYNTENKYMSNIVSSTANISVGFRPVLNYIDTGSNNTTFWG